MRKFGVSLLAVFFMVQSVRAVDFVSGANSWLESRMTSGPVSISSLFYLFLGGLLASLLPCVYPIYPITATLLRNRSVSGQSRWSHPLIYYLGLACIYFVFGIIAALSGGAFNQILRLPETNLALAFLFLLLALSTAGFIQLSFLHPGDSGQVRPGLLGTFFMGAGAGLLSSSCVGPFVVSILVKIAGSVGHISAGATLAAASQMMLFGFGLGVPILLIGLFGLQLPKSGKWMRYVQIALGLVILYFCYVYLEKGLSSLGFSKDKIRLVFAGALVFLYGGYRLQNDEVDGYRRMGRALAGLLAAIGFVCLQGSLAPAPVVPTNAGESAAMTQMEKDGNLSWHLDYREALADADKQGKPLFVDFSAHWCANCKAFQELTQSNAKFNGALSKVVLCKVEDTTEDFKNFQADPRFPELKVGLPFFIVLDGQGNLLFKTSDYTKTDDMMLFLE
jgi:thiol:disulfide interchange protein DsbD